MVNDVVNHDGLTQSGVEWRIRCDLAALYRICDHYGWTDSINTHMSVRVPGEPTCFLINNYGDLFSEITASSLVKMDTNGNIYTKNGGFNDAGFVIHAGIYKARSDVNCVMHTHVRAGTGVSLLKQGLRPISQDALEVYDELAYHEYGSLASHNEGDALGVTCQKGECVILRNHGLLTIGATVQAALQRMYMLVRACEIEIIARGLDEPPTPIEPDVVQDFAKRNKAKRALPEFGMAEWRAVLRRIEICGANWRQ
ncbi:class II aldolase/adducin family protein [Bradyrhizobium elkanii]|uniref:class II aldolase/adducin family protein n=1 Tax=Bradyrhizobium elkanii TaxID=29448 RepID=UPI001BAB9B37|nr:class II aldolase/adducin family protein [Bradyrhizobium elkanii]MBR1165066.1 class II aldolase/adducin family protein [Bradyrhizobium elkanii]